MDRSEQLIEIAHQLFGRYGYERTTMDDIAREAGISKGAVYLHFKSKEELLIAAIHRCMEAESRLQQQAFDACNTAYLQCLRDVMLRRILFVFDRMSEQNHSLDSLIRTGHRIRQTSLHYFQEHLRQIAAFLRKTAEAGEIPPQPDYDQVAYYLMSALSGLYPPYEPKNTVRPDDKITRQDLEQTASFILSAFLSGLKHNVFATQETTPHV